MDILSFFRLPRFEFCDSRNMGRILLDHSSFDSIFPSSIRSIRLLVSSLSCFETVTDTPNMLSINLSPINRTVGLMLSSSTRRNRCIGYTGNISVNLYHVLTRALIYSWNILLKNLFRGPKIATQQKLAWKNEIGICGRSQTWIVISCFV